MTDITVIKRALADRAQAVAEHLLPAGIREGREWCAGSTAGDAGRSLKLCLTGPKAGTWADFAAGESGDLIDLWCAVRRQTLTEALDDIRAWLGIERPAFEKPTKTYRRPPAPKAESPQSAVLSYLTDQRKISDETIALYRVREAGRTIVFPSLLPGGALAFVKYLEIDRDAVEHAYEGANAPGEIEVHARIADARTLEIDVADRGRFIEREQREGRGFGMRILRSVARAVAIETDNGTRVHMLFDIAEAA